MLWFNFISSSIVIFLCFALIIINYHARKQTNKKIEPRVNLNPTYKAFLCTEGEMIWLITLVENEKKYEKHMTCYVGYLLELHINQHYEVLRKIITANSWDREKPLKTF